MDRGYSTHSRHMMDDSFQKDDQPVLTQLKKAYWTTKQQIRKTIGKKEDEHITASDAQLDAKLELFTQIKLSCIDLLKVILLYQKRLVSLAREENAMGKFLRIQGEEDSTQAGKMMSAVGKSQSFSAQHRIQMRHPLYRLFQEVETFRVRAVGDTQLTVTKMEEARTEYRGALLWMKDVSERLDPDAYNRLEKFRKVQSQVRKAKEVFDKHKLDVLQKVDLLAASRGNMFSHALATYQNSLLSFWKKTSKTMTAVSETFKGFQYYEFNLLKSELDETTKELARETASERTTELLESLLQDTGHNPTSEEDKLIYDIIMSLQNKHEVTQKAINKQKNTDKSELPAATRRDSTDSLTGLIDFDEKDLENEDARVDEQFGEFQAAMDKESKDLRLIGQDPSDKYSALRQSDDDLLLDDIFGPDQPPFQSELEDLSLTSGDLAGASGYGDGASASIPQGFLPSDLLNSTDLSSFQLDGNQTLATVNHSRGAQGGIKPPAYTPHPQPHGLSSTNPSAGKTPMSTWYNLFADLDPLQDPDAVGKNSGPNYDDGCA